MNYNILNKNLKELTTLDDPHYQHLQYLISIVANDYKLFMSKYSDIIDLDEDFHDKISYIEILKQVCKFLKVYNYQYYETLKKIYKQKYINLDLDKIDDAYTDFQNGHAYINFPISFVIDDAFCLIHEFIHYLNCMEYVSETHAYFTETLSILFEFLFYDYLENNNYLNKEYLKVKLLKFLNCYDNAEEICYGNDLMNFYFKYKKITKDLIRKHIKDKKIVNKFENICRNYSNVELPFFQNKKYLIGTILACDMHQRIINNPQFIEKVYYMIENINELNFDQCLEIFNIRGYIENGIYKIYNNDYQRIMNNVKQELEITYKKYKEGLDEKSYCDCRANRCW